jgi:DNA-binding NtrC family response regulator
MPERNILSVESRASADVWRDNNQPTILLAEDEPNLRQILVGILKAAGYNLMIAEDGQQALQLANEHAGKIDLLLSDVQMPGLTGPDLANELERSRPYLKVVLMSGCPSPSGAFKRDWRYLQKPFQLNELLEEVRVVLRGTSLDQRFG